MENLATEEKDYYELFKSLLNKKYTLVEKYILAEKLKLNSFQLECIKIYFKTLEKIKSLEIYFEQVKHVLSNIRTIKKKKLERLELLRYKRDDFFNDLFDYQIIDLA